jgi:hypothetical protein
MFSLAIFGANKIAGSELEPGERAVALALFGGMELDFSTAPAPFVDVVVIALFGGVVVKVQPTRPIRLAGFSIFGGRLVEPRQLAAPNGSAPTAAIANGEDDEEFPLEINAYAVFGGVAVKRAMSPAGETPPR